MIRTGTTRDAWRPQNAHDREAILLALQEVLSSPHFCNSKRYPALLQHIVGKTLAGESDQLKERTLGVEVFDRPPSYDTNADTVVRYTAGEVRKRLSLYYSELGRKPRIRISLPPGSYVPEFFHEHDEPEESGEYPGHFGQHVGGVGHFADLAHEVKEPGQTSLTALVSMSKDEVRLGPALGPARERTSRRRSLWLAAIMAIALLGALGWKYHAARASSAVDDFWAPALRDQRTVPICAGVVVFAQNNYSGVVTAGKDADYPFVSIQGASAIASLSALLDRSGVTTQLVSAATTSLPELREHPVILLGGYNNQWTMRLLQPLRFHFTHYPPEAIADQTQPARQWARDESLPYSSADDYAVLARFRDATTDSWVIVLAGVGRNGTEAAAQFATSPHYMQLLRDQVRDQVGSDFANRNIEAVLKVSVIEGKTGAPSILAVHVW